VGNELSVVIALGKIVPYLVAPMSKPGKKYEWIFWLAVAMYLVAIITWWIFFYYSFIKK
jgi:hypothetical protein